MLKETKKSRVVLQWCTWEKVGVQRINEKTKCLVLHTPSLASISFFFFFFLPTNARRRQLTASSQKSEKLANSDMILNSFLRGTVSISVERATPWGNYHLIFVPSGLKGSREMEFGGGGGLSRRAGRRNVICLERVGPRLLVSWDRVISYCRFSRKGGGPTG